MRWIISEMSDHLFFHFQHEKFTILANAPIANILKEDFEHLQIYLFESVQSNDLSKRA